MELYLKNSDEILSDKFQKLSNAKDVSDLLEIPNSVLTFYLYKIPIDKKYHEFNITKKSGGTRKISSPIDGLKIIQKKLCYILQLNYSPKASSHGFVKSRNIVTNAQLHIRKKYILNIDLKDFFPSITFPRVFGLFKANPFNFNKNVSGVLAQICCFKGQLPQGAPTAPIVSNLICSKMDSKLRLLAKELKCDYTRYADDITFSTTRKVFPVELVDSYTDTGIKLGKKLIDIINNNYFEVNPSKVRLLNKKSRLEVTGLTVNEFPNVKRTFVRQIRAMLYDWDKNGLDKAEKRFLENLEL